MATASALFADSFAAEMMAASAAHGGLFSTRKLGMPATHGRAPVNAFKQHRQLRRRQRYGSRRRHRPDEASLFQTLGEQTQTLAIPPQQLNQIAALAPESKQRARMRILHQDFLHHDSQAIKTATHVGRATGQINAPVRRQRDHRAPNASRTDVSKGPSTPS